MRTDLMVLVAAGLTSLAVGCSSQDGTANAPPGSDAGVDGSTDASGDVPVDTLGDGPSPDGSCFPATCSSLGANCGTTTDGCGGILDCGSCEDGSVCGGDGPNRCGSSKCQPGTCEGLGADCGLVSDGCSAVLNCGGCPPPSQCGGNGTPNRCECTPTTCATASADCGTMPDGCGGVLDCGDCEGGQTCGGGGPNRCGTGSCSPKSCTQIGASCGWVSDGCAEAIPCGECESPNTCGGGGEPNQCGCLAKSCAHLGASCGPFDTGCGVVDCGSCTSPETCGGGGVAHVCGCSCSLPNAITACSGGVCSLLACQDGWGDCNGNASDGCEASFSTNVNHCGGCGTVCAFPNASAFCNGQCQMGPCVQGFDDCDGAVANGCEANLWSSPSNCGACGSTCSLPHVSQSACSGGSCSVETCSAGWSDCDGIVGNGCECGGGQYCQAGACYDYPTMTWTPICMNGGVDHLAPDYLYDYKIYGRPGATYQKYNRHISCGKAAYAAETGVIGPSGWVGETLETSAVSCFETLGEWETWAIVDGHETNRLFVTFYSSLCTGASTCSQAKSYCWGD